MRKVDSLLIEAYELLGLDSIMEMDYSQKRMNEANYSKTDAGQYNSQTDKEQFQDWLQIQMLTDSF